MKNTNPSIEEVPVYGNFSLSFQVFPEYSGKTWSHSQIETVGNRTNNGLIGVVTC